MFRQSPSRNQRSKGFRIKHGLQIFLLLAICFWLLYQLKHSHDKKKAFDQDSLKLDVLKLGRKHLHPQLEEEKSSHYEISGKEQVMDGDEDDERNKPEEEEEETKPVKGEKKGKHDEQVEEENEEEGRGAGDDEIDEQDQEEAEEEAENGDNSLDEDDKDGKEGDEEGHNGEHSIDGDDKEGTEERENTEKVKETKNDGLLDDQDHDTNTQKAREVNYKGDDASSAVLRETQVVTAEAESGNLGDSTEKLVKSSEKDTSDLDDKTNSTENSASSHDIPEDKMVSGAMIEGNNSSNLKTTEEKGIEGNISTNVKTNEENRNSELQTNSTITKSDGSPVVNNTSGAEEVHPSNSFVQNTTLITSGSAEDTIHERATDDGGESKLLSTNQAESSNVTTELEKSISDNRISTPIENADVTKGEFSDTSNNDVTAAMEEQTLKSSSTVDEEKSSLSSTTNANVKVGATDETEEALSIATENAADVTQSLSNESNNLGISHEETDLGTLAESETEGMKGEDVAAE